MYYLFVSISFCITSSHIRNSDCVCICIYLGFNLFNKKKTQTLFFFSVHVFMFDTNCRARYILEQLESKIFNDNN